MPHFYPKVEAVRVGPLCRVPNVATAFFRLDVPLITSLCLNVELLEAFPTMCPYAPAKLLDFSNSCDPVIMNSRSTYRPA